MSMEDRLFRAIGEADEALLERSERSSTARRRIPWAVLGGLAACACLVLFLVTFLPYPQKSRSPSQSRCFCDWTVKMWVLSICTSPVFRRNAVLCFMSTKRATTAGRKTAFIW